MKRTRDKKQQDKEDYIDFAKLAEKYPEFEKFIKNAPHGNVINWKDPEAQRILTKTILLDMYNIKINLPLDQLCPKVPSRVHYIRWLSDLLNHKSEIIGPSLPSNKSVCGIDIGTGASCIYPLLGNKIYGWRFVCTDVDDISLKYASQNIKLNELDNFIELRKGERGNLIENVIKEDETFDFCMCNPPFFESLGQTALNKKEICTATENELMTDGGEYLFVSQLIKESMNLQIRITWYTSLIGRKVDLIKLEKLLYELKIRNVRTFEFCPGKTSRWIIAWSFTTNGLQDLVDSKLNKSKKHKIDKSDHKNEYNKSELSFSINNKSPQNVLNRVVALISSEPSHSIFTVDKNTYTIQGKVLEKFWNSLEQTQKENNNQKKELFQFELQLLTQGNSPSCVVIIKCRGNLEKIVLNSFCKFVKDNI